MMKRPVRQNWRSLNNKDLKEFIIDIIKYTGKFIIRNRK